MGKQLARVCGRWRRLTGTGAPVDIRGKAEGEEPLFSRGCIALESYRPEKRSVLGLLHNLGWGGRGGGLTWENRATTKTATQRLCLEVCDPIN